MKEKKLGRPQVEKDVSGHALEAAMAHPEPEEHEKEGWARTLIEAHEIKNDPKKMEHLHGHLEKKMGQIKSIQDLKDVSKAKFGKKREKIAELKPSDLAEKMKK